MLNNKPTEQEDPKLSMSTSEINERMLSVIKEKLAVINFILGYNGSELELVQLINGQYRLTACKK